MKRVTTEGLQAESDQHASMSQSHTYASPGILP